MLRQSTFVALLWLFAIALLPVRIANAHLHMCLDGKDKTVTVHVDDVPTHHGSPADTSEHNDVDLDVPDSAIAKKAGVADDLSFDLLGAYVLALVLPEPEPNTPTTAYLAPEIISGFGLRPPSRGPPR